MTNPIIIEFLDGKDKVTSTEMYLSVEDFIDQNKDRNVNVIMYKTKKITSEMRINYTHINKDDKFYILKNDKIIKDKYIQGFRVQRCEFKHTKSIIINII